MSGTDSKPSVLSGVWLPGEKARKLYCGQTALDVKAGGAALAA